MELEALAPTRTRKQRPCTSTKKTTWTQDEDELLIKLMNQSPTKSWSLLMKYFPNKTAQQISGRWDKVLNPQLIKGNWTREEDEIILKFVEQNGLKDWAKLATILTRRNGKQCRERYKNHLDTSLKREPWTPEEDEKLIEIHNKLGNQWTKIVEYFPGRTDNCIKNRWNSTLKKRIERLKNGEPLIQKRGRKPKKVLKQESDSSDEEDYDSICSSPIPNPVSTFSTSPSQCSQIIGCMPLFDSISMFNRSTVSSGKANSLQQNRDSLTKMLEANVVCINCS